jgi:hypothetical protein
MTFFRPAAAVSSACSHVVGCSSPSSPRTSGCVSRSGWWTKLKANRPLTQRLPSFGRYSSFDVTLTMCFVSGSRFRSIWQPTPQNVQVVRTCSSERSGAVVPSSNFS